MSFNYDVFNNEDYLIQITPHILKKDNRWDGEVTVNIISNKDNGLHVDDDVALNHLCRCMASSLPLMEIDPAFMRAVEEFASTYNPTPKEKGLTVVQKDGNVIKLDFKLKKG